MLHQAGFTRRPLDPSEQAVLPLGGIGITNLVPRASAAAAQLGTAELRAGAGRLEALVAALGPGFVAVLGMGAYRSAFGRPGAVAGEQPAGLSGARLWVLPNPSGLQASYQLPEMVALYGALARAAAPPGGWRIPPGP